MEGVGGFSLGESVPQGLVSGASPRKSASGASPGASRHCSVEIATPGEGDSCVGNRDEADAIDGRRVNGDESGRVNEGEIGRGELESGERVNGRESGKGEIESGEGER